MRAAFGLQRMSAHEKMLKLDQSAPALVTTRDVVEWATLNGARANGLAERTGSLSVGKQADVIMLRTDLVNVMPLNNARGAIVLGMDTSNVDTVIVAGRIVKRSGKMLWSGLAKLQRELVSAREFILTNTQYDLSPTATTICNYHHANARPPANTDH
jgi:cytosine/adenosine deaminase-related metal-dependent hydrolase